MRTSPSPRASLVDAALDYAERGWPVLPLVPRKKNPLTQRGLLDASDDLTTVLDWWEQWPMANIGIRTGIQFDVLDIDGEVGRASLSAKMGPGPEHLGPISRTGKGHHWLFKPTNTANRAGILEKVDWRGTNGYIVAPPSRHPEGHLYAWEPDHGPKTPLPEVPDWLTPHLVAWTERKEYPKVKANPYGTNIVDIAEAAGYTLRHSGNGRYNINCPFHPADDTPSLVLYPDDNSFYCYGCHAWGDITNFVSKRPRYKNG